MRLYPKSYSKCGFTLPEVCVAIAVFATGMTALLYCAGSFEKLCSMEKRRVESVTAAVSRMESLVDAAPACSDTLHMYPLSPSLRRALAGARLFYAETGDSLVRFRRIVWCR